MPQAQANGITLEYEVCGRPDGRPLLLIHGLGAQLIRWPQALVDGFAAAGFRVIRYDSRDVGLSTHMDAAPVPDLAAALEACRRGEDPGLPYTVADLARDAAGLLDRLGIERADVLGVSLGGQVAQTLAAAQPERLLSLNVFMSHSGAPELPPAQPQALAQLTGAAPDPFAAEAAFLDNAVAMGRALGSPDYPIPEADLRRFALAAARRAYYPAGAARQLAAGRTAPDMRPALRRLDIPTLVVHGADDPLIPLAGGEDIARNVEGSLLLTIKGMGHDLPPQLFEVFIDAVAMNVRRAGDRGGEGPRR
jgi:pimeloyl-ACP methyl ester carboxylesterase